MKVKIKSTLWIIEKIPEISAQSYEPPITLIFGRHENHIGWLNVTDLTKAKEIILTEGKQ